ncbi:MAG TPA: hypothetical protein VFR02_01920, partial [bacterium]|nr:hypothetical protein [bacterium]
DVGEARAALERLEKVFLGAAPKVQEAFGLDLGPADFRLVYFSGPLGKTLLALEDGKPVLPEAGTTPTPRPR